MATTMHRLQISLPKSQMQYLNERARRERASIAELIRQVIQREVDAQPACGVESLWEIVGLGQEREPLIGGIPVSERPDLYLAALVAPRRAGPARRAPRPRLSRAAR